MLCKHCLFSFFSFTPTNFSICHSQVSITNVFTLRAENQVTLSWTAHTAYSLLISTITKHTSPFGLAPGAGLYPCSLQAPREEKKKSGQFQFQTQKVALTVIAFYCFEAQCAKVKPVGCRSWQSLTLRRPRIGPPVKPERFDPGLIHSAPPQSL